MVVNIIYCQLLLHACTVLYANMLKETENEETRLFSQICVIGGISIEGAQAPWATPMATPMILR